MTTNILRLVDPPHASACPMRPPHEHVCVALPSSRKVEQTLRLLSALTLYRKVFGQPQQEDALRFLREHARIKTSRGCSSTRTSHWRGWRSETELL